MITNIRAPHEILPTVTALSYGTRVSRNASGFLYRLRGTLCFGKSTKIKSTVTVTEQNVNRTTTKDVVIWDTANPISTYELPTTRELWQEEKISVTNTTDKRSIKNKKAETLTNKARNCFPLHFTGDFNWVGVDNQRWVALREFTLDKTPVHTWLRWKWHHLLGAKHEIGVKASLNKKIRFHYYRFGR